MDNQVHAEAGEDRRKGHHHHTQLPAHHPAAKPMPAARPEGTAVTKTSRRGKDHRKEKSRSHCRWSSARCVFGRLKIVGRQRWLAAQSILSPG